jgi:hypothetical protein
MFPLPTARRSTPRARASQSPEGIEPRRKPRTIGIGWIGIAISP